MKDKKKKIAIVFAITDTYTDMLANALIGLKKHDKTFWDNIIIYHEDVSERHQSQLNQILPCVFQKVSSEVVINSSFESQLKEYRITTFAKFECFKLLDYYEKVIWHDIDVLFQKSQLDLLDYVNTDSIALVKSKDYLVEHNFFKLIPEYNMFEPMYYFGLMILSDQLEKYSEMSSWCYRKANEYGERIKYYDNAVLNLLIQEYQLKIHEIDAHRFFCHPLDLNYTKDASIIHAYDSRKFWNDLECKNMFPEWVENYNEWKKIQFSNKDENPLVSVLMSSYNRYDFLKEAVESILNQTYPNLELIVVLEFCENQEKLEQILNSYHDKRIRIIKNQEKLGFPRSLNVGFDLARGKYIARMDDDDISLPERLEKQVEFMEKNPDIGACGTRAEFFMYASGIFEYIPVDSEEVKVKMLSFSTICHPSIMMRKELFDKYNLRYNPDYFTEDYELWSRAIQYFKIANLDEVLLKYRASKQSLTGGSNEEKMHASHKKIIQNQCRQYLGIELTDNELELLQGRKEIIGKTVDLDGALQIRNKLYEKIMIANQKKNFYDEHVLRKFFNIEDKNQKNGWYTSSLHCIKKGIKAILRPIYRPILSSFERRTYKVINDQRYLINDYNNELKNQILLEIKNQNVYNTRFQKALLIRNILGKSGFGSSINDFVTQRHLNQGFMNVESMNINQINFLQDDFFKVEKFFDDHYKNLFIEYNQELINKIENIDWVVIDGTDYSLTYSEETFYILYFIYLAKCEFHKHIACINTYIDQNSYTQNISVKEQEIYDKILTTVIPNIDYFTVRDYHSFMRLSTLKLETVVFAFHLLPFYVKKYYTYFDLELKEDYIVVCVFGDISKDYEDSLYEIYKQTKKKVYVLYWDGKNQENDNQHLISERMSKKIGKDIVLFKTANIDETISLIDDAQLLISDDCYYTMVSFMTNTPFIVLKGENRELETILDMIEYKNRFVDPETILDETLKLLKNPIKDNNQRKQEELVGLVKNNFNFMNEE